MELLLQQVLAGLATGGIYACMALAVVMIYQAIDHLNFAQGEMAMFSTFIAWQVMQWGQPYWLAFIASVVLSFLGGVLIERVLFKPIHNAPILSNLVAFIALFSILNSLAGFIWDFNIKEFPTPFGSKPFLGITLISTHQAGMIGVTLGMLALLYLFFRGTRLGLAMRAAAANPESARLVGIRVGWMTALGWGMAAAIGAVAGVLIAPVVFLEPNMMLGVLLYGFAGAVLGGLTSPGGAAGWRRQARRRARCRARPARRDRRVVGDRAGDPARGQELYRLSADPGNGLRAGDPRSQPADRLQRPVLIGAQRVLRHRRLYRSYHDAPLGHHVFLDLAVGRARVLRGRLSVRPAGIAAAGSLPGAGYLRARRGDAADTEIRPARTLDRRRAGLGHRQARPAVRPADRRRPVALLLHAGGAGVDVRRCYESSEQPLGPRNQGNPRQP